MPESLKNVGHAGIRAALVVLLVGLPLCVGAQAPISPSDPLYGHLRMWEQRGVIDWLPPIRPLPAPVVRFALQQVAGSGRGTDREIARILLSRHFGQRSWQVEGQVGIRSKAHASVPNQADTNAERPVRFVPQAAAGVEIPLGDHAGVSLSARSLTTSAPVRPAPADRVTPYYAYDPHDPYDPIAGGDGITLLGQEFHVDLSGNLFVGPPALRGIAGDWYAQAGFGRSSFGFGEDSTIVSAYAPPAGYLSAVYRGTWATWSALFLDLVAAFGCSRTDLDSCALRGEPYRLKGEAAARNDYPSKYLVVQSLSVHPTEWLELTALQSVMFGGRLSLAYFLPVVPSQYVQTYLGDYDNALIGAAVRVRLPFGAHAGAVLYVDDLNFRKIRNFDFDSGQNKLALDLQAGIAPPLPILTVLDARYRMVTPYMYAHHPAALDYLQYTHKGRHLGTLLPPNSDEITVRTRVFPAPWLAFDLSVRSVRHGGGCGGVPDSSCTIWHHGRVDDGFLFHGPSEFLTQAVLEGILQARAGIDVHVDLEPVDLRVALAYTYEQVSNRELQAGADAQAHLIEVSTSVRY